MAGRPPDQAGAPAREELSALRSLLVLFMLLIQQDSQTSILHYAANAVGSLCRCTTQGIFLDGQWRDVGPPDQEGRAASRPVIRSATFSADITHSMQVELAGVPWAYAYSLASPHGPSGYLVVGAEQAPADGERFLLQVLAQQTGVALAKVRLLTREREQAAELRAANLALAHSMKVHQTLTRVALAGEGQDGIALAVYQLTGRAVAIEDRFGNLRAWAGPSPPAPYPKATADQRDRFLDRLRSVGRPLRSGEHLFSMAALGGMPVGVLALHDPDGTAGDTEIMALEYAGTVLAMEIARIQSAAETDIHLRANLVLDLITAASPDEAAMLNRAQVLGYDLSRPHRVILVDTPRNRDDVDLLLLSVSRAARQARIGSLLAPRQRDVVVLADAEASWKEFHRDRGGGTAGRRQPDRRRRALQHDRRGSAILPGSPAGAAGPENDRRAGAGDDVQRAGRLPAAGDLPRRVCGRGFRPAVAGRLNDYDTVHGTQLVLTLSEFLDHGGSYSASSTALSVHRNTLKYRLRRIKDVSGHDLGVPDTVFNLQLATRAWRTLQALRPS